jgi:myo-inositol-1-phosphate synthase
MARSREKVGLWVVGACGGVATTAIVGIEAIRRRLADPTGLIGHLPPFDRLRLAPLDAWVVGGHEIRHVTPEQSARELLEESRIFSPELLTACRRWLQACAREIRDGTALGCGPAIEGMVDRRGSRQNCLQRGGLNV